MASIDKIVDKMKRQPNGVRVPEADKVLKSLGYELRNQEGSHIQYKNEENGDLFTLVHRNHNIKKFYVDEILKKIKD